MKNIYLNTVNLPRELSVCPRVRSLGSYDNHPFMTRQYIDCLQICLRFHSTLDKVCFDIDGREYEAAFQHLLIKREGEIHCNHDPRTSDSFYFTYDTANAPTIPENLVVCEIQATPEINRRIHDIISLVDNSCDYGVFDRVDGMCQQLLIELLLLTDTGEPHDEEEAKIRRIASYLQVHFSENLSFEELARHFCYSPRSLYRHWFKYFDQSPHEYVCALRLEEARRLLRESELSVEYISERLNYGSSAYFVSIFRKYHKMTPLQYRKKKAVSG